MRATHHRNTTIGWTRFKNNQKKKRSAPRPRIVLYTPTATNAVILSPQALAGAPRSPQHAPLQHGPRDRRALPLRPTRTGARAPCAATTRPTRLAVMHCVSLSLWLEHTSHPLNPRPGAARGRGEEPRVRGRPQCTGRICQPPTLSSAHLPAVPQTRAVPWKRNRSPPHNRRTTTHAAATPPTSQQRTEPCAQHKHNRNERDGAHTTPRRGPSHSPTEQRSASQQAVAPCTQSAPLRVRPAGRRPILGALPDYHLLGEVAAR
ncbi:hypothetical protein TCSYLVIO_008514 [Trypanosoma cruzi]|nr:hypothetical protein TCSYLVIO_008514 [Trypanosoma cruzi]